MRSIVHHQVGSLVLDAKVEDADNMRVHQVAQMTRFREKVLGGMRIYLSVQDFDGTLAIEVDVLAQVDVGKGTLPEQAGQPVVAQALPYAIRHIRFSSCKCYCKLMRCSTSSRSDL